jgi:hypothetical protein
MKKLSLITAGLMAAGLVSSFGDTFGAFTTYYITGSSAFRGNVNTAVKNDGTALGLDNATSTVIGTAFSTTASSLVFSNQISGTPVLIKTSFTGSEAGIASLFGNITLIDPTPANANAPIPGTPLPTFLDDQGLATAQATAQPDIALADTSQSVSQTKTPALNTVGGATLGIVQFTWMKGAPNSQANYTHLVNLTVPELNILLSAGSVDLSFVTGVSDDFGTPLKLTGRNFGSGTRVNELIESLYGVGKQVSQFAANPTYAANGVLNKAGLVNNLTEAQFVNIGNDGYDSGGGVANVLGSTGSFTGIPVGPIGLVDATSIPGITLAGSAITGNATAGFENGFSAAPGGQFLSLNGVFYSDQGIINGAYDYYGHEHMYTGPHSQANAVTFAGKLFNDLQASLTGGINGIPVPDLFADRPADGDTGFVAPTYAVEN